MKKWNVTYNHEDGRNGVVEVTTDVTESKSKPVYGNGKFGCLFVDGLTVAYDLRYHKDEDLHMAMIQDYFGEGFVKAVEA